MTQLDLTLARRSDPPSSHEAARRSRPRRESLKTRIKWALVPQVRAIDADTLAAGLCVPVYDVRKRLPEMEREGLVRAVNRESMQPGDVLLWVLA